MTCRDNIESTLISSITETNHKLHKIVLPAIRNNINNVDFEYTNDGADILEIKNSVMLSYIIDLNYLCHLQSINRGKDILVKKEHSTNLSNENYMNKIILECLMRLEEMKTILYKLRTIEKINKYDIENILSYNSINGLKSEKYNHTQNTYDSLTFRPDPDAMVDHNLYNLSQGPTESQILKSYNGLSRSRDLHMESDNLDIILSTVSSGNNNKLEDKNNIKNNLVSGGKKSSISDLKPFENQNIYKSPRLRSIPYDHTTTQKELQEKLCKMQRKRRHTSELLQTIKSKYSDRPEEEDYNGGVLHEGRKALLSKMTKFEAEHSKFEEDRMLRMTMTRKDKKLRKRLMRESKSNLGSMTDIRNITEGFDSEIGDTLIDKLEK